jgi:hypothetical protein
MKCNLVYEVFFRKKDFFFFFFFLSFWMISGMRIVANGLI